MNDSSRPYPSWAPEELKRRHQELAEPVPKGRSFDAEDLEFRARHLAVLELLIFTARVQPAWKTLRRKTTQRHNALMKKARAIPEPRLLDVDGLFEIHVDELVRECMRAYQGPGRWDGLAQAELAQEITKVANALRDYAAALKGSPADDSVLEILPGELMTQWFGKPKNIVDLFTHSNVTRATRASLVLESIAANVEARHAAYETLRVYPNSPTHRRFCARLLYQHMRSNYRQPLHATVALLTGVLLRDPSVTIDMIRPAWTSLTKEGV